MVYALLIIVLVLACVLALLALSLVQWRRRALKWKEDAITYAMVNEGREIESLDEVALRLFECRSYLNRKDLLVPSTISSVARRSVLQSASLRIGEAIDHLTVYKNLGEDDR